MWGWRVGFAAVICLTAGCCYADSMSLKQAVAHAVLHNPKIDAAQAGQRASEYVLDQAKGRLYPEVDLYADVGAQRVDRPEGLGPAVNDTWRNRRQVTLSVRQILFDGFDRANDIYRSQARIRRRPTGSSSAPRRSG